MKHSTQKLVTREAPQAELHIVLLELPASLIIMILTSLLTCKSVLLPQTTSYTFNALLSCYRVIERF